VRLLKLFLIVVLFATCKDDDKRELDRSVVYFEVAEVDPVHGDSYLLPLRNADDIAAARQMLEEGEQKLIVAEISNVQADKVIVNKDINNNRKWSWYVSNFIEFTDMTIEIYDGWPEYVEENYDEWVRITKGENGKGRIGFWNYTIKREVPFSELE
jgi:hypothetical protein